MRMLDFPFQLWALNRQPTSPKSPTLPTPRSVAKAMERRRPKRLRRLEHSFGDGTSLKWLSIFQRF